MSDDLTARDVIVEFVIDVTGQLDHSGDRADKLLAALAAAGYTIVTTDDWEFSVLYANGIMSEDPYQDRDTADYVAAQFDKAVVVRRRPAGPWEVAPDAR